MEIVIDNAGSNKYYGEVFAVMSNYSKLVKDPKQRIRGIDSHAIILTEISFLFLTIFAFLYLSNQSNTIYLYVVILFLIAFILGIIYNVLIRRRISKFKNNGLDKKLIIEDEYVEMLIGNEQFRLNFSEMSWIIVNKYSITFLPKNEGSKIIAVENKYKSQIMATIKEKNLIVDNSCLY